MGMPDEYSSYCKNDECGMFNIPDSYCDDCAREMLGKSFDKKTVDKIIRILYEE